MTRPAPAAPEAPIPVEESGEISGATEPGRRTSHFERPRPSLVLTHPGTQGASASLTPELALQADEVGRTRIFLKISAILSGVLGACTPFLSGGLPLRLTVFACCALAMIVVLAFSRELRDERNYTRGRWMLVSYVLMAATCTGVYVIGVFSPAPMVGTLGIYFLCLGSSKRVAWAAYVSGSVLHLGPALAIAFGLSRDPGLFRADNTTYVDKLIITLLVQVVYALTFILARGSRRATINAVKGLHQALAQVQKREALLAEAHLDLDRALRGGFAGRYSERRLGPYLLGDLIGRGAMSEVYRAEYPGGVAAVKVLQRDLVADPAQVRRFLREAEIVSGLTSPHVVRVLSFGNFGGVPLERDEPPYLAMELLEGHDLAWHLRRQRRMPPARVVEIVDQIGDALHEAAAAEIVHRDLKPQNIFCVEPNGDHADRIWKVLDFGVSKLATASGSLTNGAIVGTPGYMAPEQARGERVGPRADTFSLAVIAYRALTGRPAFAGKDMPRILFDVCYAQPAQPGRLVSVSEDVERVLALGMAKEPEERLDSARAFAEALKAAFAGSLDRRLANRADELLARMPWGSHPTH